MGTAAREQAWVAQSTSPRLPGTWSSLVLLALSGNWHSGMVRQGLGESRQRACIFKTQSKQAFFPDALYAAPHVFSSLKPHFPQPVRDPPLCSHSIWTSPSRAFGSLSCNYSLIYFSNLPVSLLRARTGFDASLCPRASHEAQHQVNPHVISE